MKLLLDACVLYPTVMREMLLGVAGKRLFEPLWSERILEEWARAAARHSNEQEMQARGEIALVKAQFPKASVVVPERLMTRLWLPDDNDIHVLGAAIEGFADQIVTLNAKDFPRGILAEEGLGRIDPDTLLIDLWQRNPEPVEAVAERTLTTARQISGEDWQMRPFLKKARMPRLAKALGNLTQT